MTVGKVGVAVLRERATGESRVAATPESVRKLRALGVAVRIESGAGAAAHFSDAQYEAAGAVVGDDMRGLLDPSQLVLSVRRPGLEVVEQMAPGMIVVGMLSPYGARDAIAQLADAGVDAFSMELLPRIGRAQSMDALTSQSNLAGYRAVIDAAAAAFGRAMPMMMTAAGTIAPAKVFVLGAGVAGLQAIATARRLGAVVSATDVRPAVKEQVESLGATFVMVESEESKSAETSRGYAKEMSEDYRRRQTDLVANTVTKQDIVITTALIPGRPAPVLLTEAMIESMRAGSIVVDLAVEQGGNCPLARPGEVVEHHGVRILGYTNVPGRLPADASALYARNLLNFIAPFVTETGGGIVLDWDDEVVHGTGLTRDGQLVHPMFRDES